MQGSSELIWDVEDRLAKLRREFLVQVTGERERQSQNTPSIFSNFLDLNSLSVPLIVFPFLEVRILS